MRYNHSVVVLVPLWSGFFVSVLFCFDALQLTLRPTAQGNVANGKIFQLAPFCYVSLAVIHKYSIGCIWNCPMRKHSEHGGKQV